MQEVDHFPVCKHGWTDKKYCESKSCPGPIPAGGAKTKSLTFLVMIIFSTWAIALIVFWFFAITQANSECESLRAVLVRTVNGFACVRSDGFQRDVFYY